MDVLQFSLRRIGLSGPGAKQFGFSPSTVASGRLRWPSAATFTNNEPVVVGVRADPNPRQRTFSYPTKGALMVSYTNCESITAALQSTEVK